MAQHWTLWNSVVNCGAFWPLWCCHSDKICPLTDRYINTWRNNCSFVSSKYKGCHQDHVLPWWHTQRLTNWIQLDISSLETSLIYCGLKENWQYIGGANSHFCVNLCVCVWKSNAFRWLVMMSEYSLMWILELIVVWRLGYGCGWLAGSWVSWEHMPWTQRTLVRIQLEDHCMSHPHLSPLLSIQCQRKVSMPQKKRKIFNCGWAV